MSIILFGYYVFLWAAGVALLIVAYFRYQRVRDPFLLSYFYFLLAFLTTAFVNIIGGSFSLLTSPQRLLSPTAIETSMKTLALLSVPLMFVCWFFYLRMMAGLIGRNVSGFIRIVYVTVQLLAVVAFGIMIASFSAAPTAALARSFASAFIIVRWSGFAIRSWALVQIVLYAGSLRDDGRRKAVLKFGGISAIFIAVYYGSTLLPPSRAISFIIYPTIYFVANYIPLLYLLTILRRESLGIPLVPPGLKVLDRLAGTYGLTRREQEIVGLILAGKDNVDIHKSLFISAGTVRNHVSSIYRKLGLKNRYQLLVMAKADGAEMSVNKPLNEPEKSD